MLLINKMMLIHSTADQTGSGPKKNLFLITEVH